MNIKVLAILMALILDYNANTAYAENGREEVGKVKTVIENENNTPNESSSLDLKAIAGLWVNEKCNLSFNIYHDKDKLHYVFKSEKRTLSGFLKLKNENGSTYIIFNGIEWSENKGELGTEYFEDEPDTQIHEKPEILPVEISALYTPEEQSFVIQNYGNSMNYYVKLEEGCEKYIYFNKVKYSQKDTVGVFSALLSESLKNYSVFYWEKGDINNDEIDDYILVLQSDFSNDELTGMPNTYERKVVLLETVDSYPNLKISAINSNIIDCSTCGGAGVGDPFQGITIKYNYFSFEQLYGACDKSFVVTTFKYDINKKKWYLHKEGRDDYSCQEIEAGKVAHTVKSKKDFGMVEFEEYKSTLF